MRLIVVRHGETNWTLAGRYTGATDLLPTANGRRQAASLPPLLELLAPTTRAIVTRSAGSADRLRDLTDSGAQIAERSTAEVATTADRLRLDELHSEFRRAVHDVADQPDATPELA